MNRKWSPWNWLQHEQDKGAERLPVSRSSLSPMTRLTELESLFDDLWRGFDRPSLLSQKFGNQDQWFRPSMDIREQDGNYLIEVEIPGVQQDDVEIRLDGDVLIIKGEKKNETEEKDEQGNCHRMERSYGSFQRSLSLPADVDKNAIEASFRDGVLSLVVGRIQPKAADSRKIEVKS